MAEHVALKNAWGTLTGTWVPHDTRDHIVDFVRRWSEKTEIGAGRFIAKDFKEFIRISGMTHVRTSQFHPQSNGKIERWHKSLKRECIRPGTPLSLDEARRLVQGYVERYNNVRLNSATGYITPKDMLAGRQQEIHVLHHGVSGSWPLRWRRR
jgi:hypothetical protein